MKISTQFSVLLLTMATLTLASCSKDTNGPVASSSSASIQFTAPNANQSYTLKKANANDTLLTLKWNKPDFGFSSAPSYTITAKNATFPANTPPLARLNKNSYAITVGKINSILLGVNAPTDKLNKLNFKVKAILGDSAETVTSKPLTLLFKPYSVCKYCPQIYVPGDYQATSNYGGNFKPAQAPSLHTISGKDVYQGYIYMHGHADYSQYIEYKFTAGKSFDTNWGTGGSSGTIKMNAGNIVIKNNGYYRFTVDLNKLTYQAVDTKWSITGDAAKGYGQDIFMTYDPAQKVWKKTLDLKAKSIKFRANQSYDINYGDNGDDGSLEYGGANIPIPSAGNYTITLDLNAYPRTYTLKKNN